MEMPVQIQVQIVVQYQRTQKILITPIAMIILRIMETHKNSHDYFIKEVRLQIQKLNSESKSNVLGFYNYIATWVFNHIAKADRLWATYMKENSGK